jgi:hypothetical protein
MPECIRTPPAKKNGLALSMKQKTSVVSARRTLLVCQLRIGLRLKKRTPISNFIRPAAQ